MKLELIAAAALIFFALCAAPALAQDKPKIYVGPSSKTLGYSPLWVGSKKGFFEQQGLDVQVVVLRGIPMVVQALAAGSIQFASGGPEPFMESSDRGLDFIITGGVINGMTAAIVAGKKYKTFEDLRGTTIGSSSLTGGTVTALREALRQKGLEYPRDYKILVVAGGSPGNLAAMQSGQISATTVAVPLNFAAEELGFNTLGRLLDAVPQFQSAALATRRSWAEKNRPLMVRFMKGMVQSMRWMHNNKEATVEFLTKDIQLKPVHALKGWEYYTQNRIWPYDGEPNMEGMKHNIKTYYEQTGAKTPVPDVSKFVDMSYLNEALKEFGKR
ncbi:MAG: ABC transporter substrate-binding protein [Deltaproteobacteria bacterium]|nr:ABC transporter substrate-binding protein [Deltaproteobacteria bacterium]